MAAFMYDKSLSISITTCAKVNVWRSGQQTW